MNFHDTGVPVVGPALADEASDEYVSEVVVAGQFSEDE
jgi:hypothetical protein